MNARVTVVLQTGCTKYPVAKATYIGTNISRFWKDPNLYSFLFKAAVEAGEDKDIFDYCNFLFSQVDNYIRRRYGGKELQLEKVVVISDDTEVESYQ